MSSRFLARLCLTAASAAVLLGCATTDYGQRSVSQSVTDKSSTEASLMLQASKFEDELKNSGAIISDPELNRYVLELTDKVSGDYQGELRVYLAEAPVFNAGILPNGAMAIYSGLMLRAESEAQLVLVLGHEFGHYYENHALERHAAASNAALGSVAFGIVTAGYGSLLGQLAIIANFMSFSRKQELECDVIGLQKVESLGYDARDAIQIWKNLNTEYDASVNKKKRKSNNSSPIFETHPNSTERMEKMEALIQTDGGVQGAREYRQRIRPFLQDWLEAELGQRDYGALIQLIGRLSEPGEDLGVLNYMRGRVYLTRAEEGDAAKAIEALESGARYTDAPAILWRDLGDTYNRQGETDKAADAFRKYLAKSPSAEDRQLINYMLSTMEG